MSVNCGLEAWQAYEIAVRKGEEEENGWHFPVSTDLAAGGTDSISALKVMNRVCTYGWPRAREEYKYKGRERRIVAKGDGLFLLKCKPHCLEAIFLCRIS